MRKSSPILVTIVLFGLLLVASSAEAASQPAIADLQVAGGLASVSRSEAGILIHQTSSRAVIDWPSFGVPASDVVEIQQPDPDAVAVIRVTSAAPDPARIFGTIRSNGRLVILAPNGVTFGPAATVVVGGLVASTGRMDIASFMAGASQLDLTAMTAAVVQNRGAISAARGGAVVLAASRVVNVGVIQAPLGRVDLAAAGGVTVDLRGAALGAVVVTAPVRVLESGPVAGALTESSGTLLADGGRITLTAAAAEGTAETVISAGGLIRAQSIGTRQGRVILSGGTQGTVHVSGEIDGSGPDGAGARVEITGRGVHLDGALIDASGAFGGGEVYLGGGRHGRLDGLPMTAATTVFSAGSVVKADALHKGDGGTVVVWGDDRATFLGKITARGGAEGGNGGFVEVSTGQGVVFKGIADTTAARGQVGRLLIDPPTVTIGNGTGTPDGSYLNAETSRTPLSFTSVEVTGHNTIVIAEDIDLENSPSSGRTGNGIRPDRPHGESAPQRPDR